METREPILRLLAGECLRSLRRVLKDTGEFHVQVLSFCFAISVSLSFAQSDRLRLIADDAVPSGPWHRKTAVSVLLVFAMNFRLWKQSTRR